MPSDKKKLSEIIISNLKLFGIGFFMGSVDLVPGVSGGTIAFVFGIYQKLLSGIKQVTGDLPRLLLQRKFKQAWQTIPFAFFLPLGLGILSAILLLANLIKFLLANHTESVWGFFFGLVVASILLVTRKITNWQLWNFLALIVACILTFWLVGITPAQTPHNPLWFFASGAVAICAMILPGISGSYILLILGKYNQVIEAITTRDLVSLSFFGLGIVFGLAMFVRVLSFLLKNYFNLTVSILIGVMIGSLRKIWPWKEVLLTTIDSRGEIIVLVEKNVLPNITDSSVFRVIFLMLLGFILMLFLSKLDKQEGSISGAN